MKKQLVLFSTVTLLAVGALIARGAEAESSVHVSTSAESEVGIVRGQENNTVTVTIDGSQSMESFFISHLPIEVEVTEMAQSEVKNFTLWTPADPDSGREIDRLIDHSAQLPEIGRLEFDITDAPVVSAGDTIEFILRFDVSRGEGGGRVEVLPAEAEHYTFPGEGGELLPAVVERSIDRIALFAVGQSGSFAPVQSGEPEVPAPDGELYTFMEFVTWPQYEAIASGKLTMWVGIYSEDANLSDLISFDVVTDGQSLIKTWTVRMGGTSPREGVVVLRFGNANLQPDSASPLTLKAALGDDFADGDLIEVSVAYDEMEFTGATSGFSPLPVLVGPFGGKAMTESIRVREPLRLVAVSRGEQGITYSFDGPSGDYVVETSTDLGDPSGWKEDRVFLTEELELTVDDAEAEQKYFRIRRQ